MDGEKYGWRVKNEGAKRFKKFIDIVSYALKKGVARGFVVYFR